MVARHDGEEVPRFLQQEEEGEEREERKGEEEVKNCLIELAKRRNGVLIMGNGQ